MCVCAMSVCRYKDKRGALLLSAVAMMYPSRNSERCRVGSRAVDERLWNTRIAVYIGIL